MESVMSTFSIYLTGVGGQGIGLLSDILIRAGDHAGHTVKGVDTHGLAQRGGVVVSQLRFGSNIYSPLITPGEADMVVSLERHEALRAVNVALKDGGTLIYYNTAWQPLEVRLKGAPAVSEADISQQCEKRKIREIRIFKPGLKDARMQNIVVLACISKHHLIPGVKSAHFRMAMDDLMSGPMLTKNLKLFDEEVRSD